MNLPTIALIGHAQSAKTIIELTKGDTAQVPVVWLETLVRYAEDTLKEHNAE